MWNAPDICREIAALLAQIDITALRATARYDLMAREGLYKIDQSAPQIVSARSV